MNKNRITRPVLIALTAALLVLAMAACFAVPSYAAGKTSFTITKQPADAEVEYPGEAEFSVEVDKPENVASWQWERIRGVKINTLTGESAATDTLVLRTDQLDRDKVMVRCVITDKDGNSVSSDSATLTILNMDSGSRSPFSRSLIWTVIVAVCAGGAMMLGRMSTGKRR